MIISETQKFIYIDPPKTASRTLYVFFDKYKPIDLGRHRLLIPKNIDYKNYDIIISVRHPYTRIISHKNFYTRRYNGGDERLGSNPSIDKFLDVCLEYGDKLEKDDSPGTFAPCSKFVETCGFDYVIKQENLIQDLKSLPFVHKFTKLPKFNEGYTDYAKETLTQEQKEKVQLWASEDFKLFNYEI